ncbi:DUF3278 domain-containing protein [Companilactobacillus futsaii]|uniref:DUF3278 domain-containing protein n=2 Tax=Companilactobacillus futsaii TaxID=938155 RepID=A0A5B7T058_9LACO|nr:DUF3278 domain-containing protein [Companilactobacillus futsaii]KRK95307.1 hypothetical protein FC88_GL002320 [Companilactobacillus futsaii JCM 17355]QCX23595.1 DUF3278 domain-containing protein [Companilactobacillus futsaii]
MFKIKGMERMKKLDKKLIKWFIGKNVFVDERIQKEVGIFATRTVFVLFVFELLFGFGIVVYASNSQIADFETLFYISTFVQAIGVLFLVYGFMLIPMAKKRLLVKEVSPEDKKEFVKRLQHSWVRIAPLEFVGFWILHSLFYFNEGFFNVLFSFKEIISALIFTIFFTLFMSLYEKMHVKTIKDDE